MYGETPMARSTLFFPAIHKAGKSLWSRTTVAIGERLSRWFCFDPCQRNKRGWNREPFGFTHSSTGLLPGRCVRQAVAQIRPTTIAGQSTQPSAVACDDPAQKLPFFPREARPLVVGRGRRLAAETQRDSLVALVSESCSAAVRSEGRPAEGSFAPARGRHRTNVNFFRDVRRDTRERRRRGCCRRLGSLRSCCWDSSRWSPGTG